MRLHGEHPERVADRLLDPAGGLRSLAQRQVGREVQVQRHVDRPVLFEDRDVVSLQHERLRERDRKHAIAQIQSPSPRLDMHDDVTSGQRVLERRLDLVGGLMSLDHRLPRRDRDDHVGEVASGRLAQPQPAELHVDPQARDCLFCRHSRLCRRAIHEDVGVLGDQPGRRRADDRRHQQRGDRVALLEAGTHHQQAEQHGQRAGQVAREVICVSTQRRAAVASRASQRDGGASEVDHDRGRQHRELIPVDPRRRRAREQVAQRFHRHQRATREQDGRLAQCAEVLGAPVSVGMLAIGRPAAEAHGKEGHDRGDHVATRLDPGRDEPKASACHPYAELQRHEQGRGSDRHERGALLRERLLGLAGRRHRLED